jgi:hypothetical protein
MSDSHGARDPSLERLDALVGTWTLEASIAPPGVVGTATFEWTLDGRFLVERAEAPGAPSGLKIVAPESADGESYAQHYFDSRGVVRLYRMTFDGDRWALLRTEPDFTPLNFCQRYVGRLADGGRTIAGRWETSPDGETWTLDFELTYRRRG